MVSVFVPVEVAGAELFAGDRLQEAAAYDALGVFRPGEFRSDLGDRRGERDWRELFEGA